jgi:hypothetical protein
VFRRHFATLRGHVAGIVDIVRHRVEEAAGRRGGDGGEGV